MPKVLAAQKAIYELGRPLKSVLVENILKPSSLVPTVVSILKDFTILILKDITFLLRMPSPSVSHPWVSTSTHRL